MTSEVSRRPLYFRPRGVVWLQRHKEGTFLTFPGPLEEETWQILSAINHRQIARVRVRGDSFEDGALVQFAPERGYLSDSRDDFPTIRSPEAARVFLTSQGLATVEAVWVRATTSRSGELFFVCVPFDMEGEDGWSRIDGLSATHSYEYQGKEGVGTEVTRSPVSSHGRRVKNSPVTEAKKSATSSDERQVGFASKQQNLERITNLFADQPAVELAPTKRLPIHKRVRFRLGAVVTVTAIVLGALAVLLPIQIEAARVSCPSREQVQVRLEELLQIRADSLEHGDLARLREIESENLFLIDARILEEAGNSRGIVAPDYEVEVIERLCDASTITAEASVTSSVRDNATNGPQRDSTTRNVAVSMTRNPWKIVSFTNQR
ncbi:hypothetical protein U6G28_09905 [Actinomycetaceae bacterium MB13-C1-2]|nr:hypothetical protein U6G28_09905 [Actinomycetaceae bacterium MB13-C1-2]